MEKKNTLGLPFRHLAISNLLAQSSEQIGLATAPIIAVYLFAATPSETAILQMVQAAPFLLLAIPAGVLTDRLPRRSMLVAAELLRASCFAIILLLLLGGFLSLPALAILSFIGGAGAVAYSVTLPGTTPLLVERQALAVANSRLELARSIAFTVGPSVAGLVYAAVGGGFAYAIALVLSLSATGLVTLIPLQRPALTHRHLLRELKEGFSFTFTNIHLRPVLLTAVIFNLSWFIFQAAFVPYAASHLHMKAANVGTSMAIGGVGMLCGALLTPRLARVLTFGNLVIVGPIGGFIGAAFMAGSVLIAAKPMVWAGFFFFGAGPVVWAAATATLRQAVTPVTLIGRVSAVITTFTFGARPLGALIATVIAVRWGASACIWAALVGFSIQLGVILLSGIRRLARVPFA